MQADAQRRFLAQGGIFVACVYGAYFGAGLGVLLLAILGIAIPDRLVRTSGLRSMLVARGEHDRRDRLLHCRCTWRGAMRESSQSSSLVGGYAGARFARRVPPGPLRVLIILIGLAAAARLLAG